MKVWSDIVSLCLDFTNVYQDHPFQANNYTVVRHRGNKKIFALIFVRDEKVYVNLKCEPMLGNFLKQRYNAVLPAFHMNKEHWITVCLDDSIDRDMIEDLVTNSFELTKPSIKISRKNN
ncbi:MAG: MmcQ/YjbR family DNA-binding protein [Acetobacterium sp.]